MDVDAVVKTIVALVLAVSMAGCSERYRYACQNPDNWDEDFCKKPICEVSQTCPEHIFKDKVRCKE